MTLIDTLFQRLRSQGRKAFIPFLPAGDPTLDMTDRLVAELVRRGANLIEIGFPYSDPIADGPVIQASYTRALDHGLRVDDIFAWARDAGRGMRDAEHETKDGASSPSPLDSLPRHRAPHPAPRTPLVAMVSYSMVYARGPERFLDEACAAGFSGAIVPDLPVEEAEPFARLAAQRDFSLILLVTPTTPHERAVQIARTSTGFLYYVSITGITGARDSLPDDLRDQIAWLRRHTELPICVGFGISKPEHVSMLRDVADGVIVGSALVRHLEQANTQSADEIIRAVGTLAESMVKALHPEPAPG